MSKTGKRYTRGACSIKGREFIKTLTEIEILISSYDLRHVSNIFDKQEEKMQADTQYSGVCLSILLIRISCVYFS